MNGSLPRLVYRLAGRLPAPLKRRLVTLRADRFQVGLLGIVVDGDGRVLLFKHTYRPFAPWGLPSGLLKPNESPGDAIAREVREETGLEVQFEQILDVRAASNPQRVDLWIRCRASGGRPHFSAEVEDARFFDAHALPPLIAEQRMFLEEKLDPSRSARQV
jgi:ADP-ribose pyrophosphatase YjhB (NUDIX family)